MRRESIDRSALRLCERAAYGDHEKLRCLRAIAGKTYRRDELRQCSERFSSDKKMRCLQRRGSYNGGGYVDPRDPTRPQPRPLPPRLVTKRFTSKAPVNCLKQLPRVANADDFASDGFFGGPKKKLRRCDNQRTVERGYYSFGGSCTVNYGRTHHSCVNAIISKVAGGTITGTHKRYFAQACSDKILTCTKEVRR